LGWGEKGDRGVTPGKTGIKHCDIGKVNQPPLGFCRGQGAERAQEIRGRDGTRQNVGRMGAPGDQRKEKVIFD